MTANPTVFISYSWDDDAHKDWVKSLADKLIAKRVNVIIDQYDCPLGTNFLHFMEQAVSTANKVLVVLTEKYKAKADGREKGVGYEGMVISAEIYDNGLSQKFIPLHRRGSHADAVPFFLKGRAGADFRNDEAFETQFEILLKAIYGHSDKPEPGTLPDFLGKKAAAKPTQKIEISHLPALHPHFVGRAEELTLLDACWQNPSANLLEFVAPGGTGKTTLVTWWLLHRLPELDAQPDAIFAFSFYSQGTGDQRQSSSDQFFSRAADFFDLKTLPTDPRERAAALVRVLRARHALLVLDGIEPLQYPPGPLEGQLKDPALRFLLKELAAAQPGLCVCTTRVAIGELAGIQAPNHQRRDVENLDEAAGIDLLQKIGVRGPEKDLRAAVLEYKGHALALRLLGNYLTDILDGDVRQRDRIPHLSDDEKSGGHARRVMEAYVKWFEEDAQSDRVTLSHPVTKAVKSPEVALLHLLGLFDRPAQVTALDALLAEPDIKGLTEGLRGLDETRMRRAFNHLKKLGLLSENPLPSGELPQNLPHLPALRHLESIDAHPLVREHFGQRLEKGKPNAWREANLRLCDYYRNLPKKHLPDTLEEMEPLYLAMAHGCRAGEQQKALMEVYWKRISREGGYSWKHLGAFGSDLTALAHLFERVWTQPSRNMSEDGQAVVLSWVGFRLRGLGRLFEAAEPMKMGLERRLKQENWLEAAKDASNLSELYLSLGQLPEAVKYGRHGVKYADKSDEWSQKIINRTALANALHQSGQMEEALRWFEEAETMQRERRPEYRFLYSLRGYQYCDLLLGLGKWENVLGRAKEGLKNKDTFYSLLDIALDQLSVGRAHAYIAADSPTKEHSAGADQYLHLAVEGFRKAGTTYMLPLGLLARAAWHRQCGRYAEAHTDLGEVLDIAESGHMGLYLADYHLEMARLARAQGQHEAAERHKAEALARIRKMGYLRRLKEAEEV